jgi:hypothetical protein
VSALGGLGAGGLGAGGWGLGPGLVLAAAEGRPLVQEEQPLATKEEEPGATPEEQRRAELVPARPPRSPAPPGPARCPAGAQLAQPFRRMTYAEAQARYGSDKPDLRYALDFKDLSAAVGGCSFRWGGGSGAGRRGGSGGCRPVGRRQWRRMGAAALGSGAAPEGALRLLVCGSEDGRDAGREGRGGWV